MTDEMQHAGEDDFPVKTLTGCCDTCGQDFFEHILEDWKGNKFVCPNQSPDVNVITVYQRGFDDGFVRRGDGIDAVVLREVQDWGIKYFGADMPERWLSSPIGKRVKEALTVAKPGADK